MYKILDYNILDWLDRVNFDQNGKLIDNPICFSYIKEYIYEEDEINWSKRELKFMSSHNNDDIIVVLDNKTNLPFKLRFRKQNGGWKPLNNDEEKRYINKANKIVFIGRCRQDGDMFALYTFDGYIMIFKGDFNINH